MHPVSTHIARWGRTLSGELMSLPSSLASGRIVGRFIIGVADGPDPDDEPDLIPARGTVTFTPSYQYNPSVTGGAAPYTLLPHPIVGMLDEEGYLCSLSPADPSKAGVRGVRLYATNDPALSVQGWTWTATTRFTTSQGITISATVPATTFSVPAGSSQDLAHLVKMPASPGVGTEQAVTLVALAQSAAVEAAEHAAVALELQRRIDAGELGSGGGVPVPGPQGPVGPVGPKGDPGVAGDAGAKGAVGATGATGPKGDKGDPGTAGTAGPKGDKGDRGDTGPQGIQGTQGPKGDTGAQGPAGPIAGAKVTVSATAPANPAVGDVWLDIS